MLTALSSINRTPIAHSRNITRPAFGSMSKGTERLAGLGALLLAGGLWLDVPHQLPEITQPHSSKWLIPAEVALGMLSYAFGTTLFISSFGRVKKRPVIDY